MENPSKNAIVSNLFRLAVLAVCVIGLFGVLFFPAVYIVGGVWHLSTYAEGAVTEADRAEAHGAMLLAFWCLAVSTFLILGITVAMSFHRRFVVGVVWSVLACLCLCVGTFAAFVTS
jgi:hypothetical protein